MVNKFLIKFFKKYFFKLKTELILQYEKQKNIFIYSYNPITSINTENKGENEKSDSTGTRKQKDRNNPR